MSSPIGACSANIPFTGDVVGQLILAICSRPLPVPSQAGSVPDGFDAWFAHSCARELDSRFSSAKQAAAEFSLLYEAELGPTSVEPAPPTDAGEPPALGATTGRSTNSELASRLRRVSRAQRYGLALLAVLALAGALVLRRALTHPDTEPPPTARVASPAASPLAEQRAPGKQPQLTVPTLRAQESESEVPSVPTIAAPAPAVGTIPAPASADARPAAPSLETAAPAARKTPAASKRRAAGAHGTAAPAAPAKPVVDLGI